MFSNHVKKSFFWSFTYYQITFNTKNRTHTLTQTHTYTYTKKNFTRDYTFVVIYILKNTYFLIFIYIYIRKHICSNFKYKIRDLFLQFFFFILV